MSKKQPLPGETTDRDDTMASFDDAAAMEEFQKAFEQIRERQSGEPPQEEEEGTENDVPEEEPQGDDEREEEPEEEETSDGDQEPSDPQPEAETKEPAPKKERKPTLWELKKEKYELLEEKEKIEAENRRLKQALEDSVYQGTYHYGKGAYAQLEKAIEDKKRAIEASDVDALVKADMALNKAQRAVEDVERWLEQEKEKEEPATEKPHAPTTTVPSVPPVSPRQMAMVQDWLGEHPTINPASPSYDVSAGQEVGAFVNYLDSYIHQNNLHGTLYSPAYFEAIENFMADRERKVAPAKEPTPRPQNVAGVKNAYGGSASGKVSPVRITLTADEKRMARTAGLSEKEWLKYKIDDMKEKK